MKIKTLLVFIVFLLFGHVRSSLAISYPQPTGYVNDFAQVFSSEFNSQLENRLSQFESDTQNEIAVLTVTSLEGQTVEQYATAIFDRWQIGKKSQDNGLLLLISPNDREVRIEVGYGLESVINDGRAGEIIRNQITPAFREQDYEKGTQNAIDQILEFLGSGTLEEAPAPASSPNFAWILFIFIYAASFMARTKSWYLGGVIGFFLGYILGHIWAIISLSIFGLVLDYILSKNYRHLKSSSKPTDFWHSTGGFKSSGGGFGGFGGGRSGGGGASGKW